jgi:integrative and conjugative element protein (TIGR02256 family)
MHYRCYLASQPAYAGIATEAQAHPGCETGGILIGRAGIVAGELVLVVAAATGPGSQAVHLPFTFVPDTAALQEALEQWRTAFAAYPVDYLGEWHTHPFGGSMPSAADTRQVQHILHDPAYYLPHGFLLIIVTPTDQQIALHCYFYPHATQQPTLIRLERFDGDIGQLLGALAP